MRVHLIGIGGAAQSALAHVYLERGDSVSGSDNSASTITEALASAGARVAIGHDAAHLGDAETVIVSTAIKENNPELVEARRRGLRVVHRARAAAELVAGKRLLAVAGTHGKTTTTTMCAAALAHLDPLVLSGGRLPGAIYNSLPGKGRFAVIEADESDLSFLELTPEVAVVTNVEADHLDRFKGLEEIHAAFQLFIARASSTLVACVDDPGSARLLAGAPCDVIGYGFEPADVQAVDYRADGQGCSFRLLSSWGGMEARLQVTGRHNVRNALAAVAAGLSLRQPLDGLVAALAEVTLPGRRMELVGEIGQARVYDDYGHHPTEVRATLEAAREIGSGPVVCAFQPHMYTRLQAFMPAFADALCLADEVLLLPVFAARDEPIPGVDSEALAGEIRRACPDTPVRLCGTLEELATDALTALKPGAVVIFMGAGDIYKASRMVVEQAA